jgi:hypothetical protein
LELAKQDADKLQAVVGRFRIWIVWFRRRRFSRSGGFESFAAHEFTYVIASAEGRINSFSFELASAGLGS